MLKNTGTRVVLLAAVAALSSATSHARSLNDIGNPVSVNVVADRVFIPQGFDDNDPSVQLVVDGTFSDVCYQVGKVDVKVDKTAKRIYVTHKAFYLHGSWCAQMTVPYTLPPIDLGMLKGGVYEVLSFAGKGQWKTEGYLPVAVAQPSNPNGPIGPDNYLYAPISKAAVEGTSEKTLVLRGTFTDYCMGIENVTLNIRPNNVIEVLPIAKLSTTGCGPANSDFAVPVSLKSVQPGRYLIHIRSLNGSSLNLVENL